MTSGSRQHSNACKAVHNHLDRQGYKYRPNLSSPGNTGRADMTVWGHGAVTLELEIKTGAGGLSSAQELEQKSLLTRGALYLVARVDKLPNGRWDMSQVDMAVNKMDYLNALPEQAERNHNE